MLNELEELGVKVKKAGRKASGALKGKKFVLTGSLEEYTRSEAKKKIKSQGGRVTSSVSDNTDYVVVGEDPGSKLDDARKKEVSIIGEEEFISMLNGQG